MKNFISAFSALIAAALLYSTTAQAQYASFPCPNGPGPGEREIGQEGGNGVLLCGYTGEAQSQQQPQGPQAPPRLNFSNMAYAAVAWHPAVKDVWAIWNVRNSEGGAFGAEKDVMDACNAAMGSGCTLSGSASDGTIGVARTQIGTVRVAFGKNPKEAQKNALANCSKDGLRCDYEKSFTAMLKVESGKPKSRIGRYNPALAKGGIKRGYVGAAAATSSRALKPWSDKVWMSGGHANFEDANAAALAQCKNDSGAECVPVANNAQGVIVVFVDNLNETRATSDQNLAAAEKDAQAKCAALKRKCKVTVRFDVATTGTQSFDIFDANQQ